MPSSMLTVMPTAIRNFNADAKLEIDWDDGKQRSYSHELLRVQCPCADCRGHSPDQAKVISGKEHVRITTIDMVGNYAIRIAFDDDHATGIYSFSQLHNEMPA